MTMRVVISYFRSGGTLLNRCLGAMPNVVIMSEVSPYKKGSAESLGTIQQQAREWYGIDLRSSDFLDSARELYEICEADGRYLVLRLWVVGEFAQGRKHMPPPTYALSAYRQLSQAFEQTAAVALVRDAIDIWISRGCQPPGFFGNYRRYVEALLSENIAIEKYEKLCEFPDATMERICEHLQLPFSDHYRKFSGFTTARGDLDVASSRARRDTRIRSLKRRRVSRASRRFIDQSEDLRAANSALGYPVSYSSAPVEPLLHAVMARLKDAARWRINRAGWRSSDTMS